MHFWQQMAPKSTIYPVLWFFFNKKFSSHIHYFFSNLGVHLIRNFTRIYSNFVCRTKIWQTYRQKTRLYFWLFFLQFLLKTKQWPRHYGDNFSHGHDLLRWSTSVLVYFSWLLDHVISLKLQLTMVRKQLLRKAEQIKNISLKIFLKAFFLQYQRSKWQKISIIFFDIWSGKPFCYADRLR